MVCVLMRSMQAWHEGTAETTAVRQLSEEHDGASCSKAQVEKITSAAKGTTAWQPGQK